MAVPSFSPCLAPLHIPSNPRAGPSIPIAQVQQVLDKPRGEEWIWGQDEVGLYQGTNKLPGHQVLSVQLTTHRLLFLLTPSPSSAASTLNSPVPTSLPSNLQIQLYDVRQTEFYTGFMRSSPKISLFLGKAYDRTAIAQQHQNSLAPDSNSNVSPSSPSSATPTAMTNPTTQADGTWTCHICSYTNPPSSITSSGPSSINDTKCGLCGILKVTSMSLPVSRSSTPLSGGKGKLGVAVASGCGKGGESGGVTASAASSPATPNMIGPSGGSETAQKSSTTTARKDIPCPRCTFLNHPSLPRCELCSTPLPSSSTSSSLTTINGNTSSQDLANTTNTAIFASASASSASSQVDLIKISFRKGGSGEMYKRLKAVLERKAWESRAAGRSNGAAGDMDALGSGSAGRMGYAGDENGGMKKGIGIDRILQDIDLDSKTKDEDVQDAFKDLEALMVRAGDMVRLVQSLSTKLEQSPSASDRETPESTFIRSSLVQLGLPVPALTQDMVKSEEAYHLGLAKELGAFLTGGVDEKGKRMEGVMIGRNGKGLLGLDEVWGLWNRARGISLVPPKTLNAVLPLLQAQTRPQISMMTFGSGLSVLHTPVYSTQSFAHRLLRRLHPDEEDGLDDITSTEKSLSAVDIALQEGVAVGLAKELVEKIETESGSIVRDEQSAEGGGEKWQRNLISLWVWQDGNRPGRLP